MSSVHLNGTTVKMSFKGTKLLGLNINDSENNGPHGLICPHPGTIYMYITIIFKLLLL